MDPTADFFNRVIQQRAQLLARPVTATIRFDLERGDGLEQWFITFDRGTVGVSREERPADCTVRASKEIFDRILTGEMNPPTAFFRHEVRVEGDLMVWAVFLKLPPGPPGARDPREIVRERRALSGE
jgi:putative sterol carrier protein